MRWAQWLKQRLEAALSCGERRCRRQCVQVDAHFDDSFAMTSIYWENTAASIDNLKACLQQSGAKNALTSEDIDRIQAAEDTAAKSMQGMLEKACELQEGI